MFFMRSFLSLVFSLALIAVLSSWGFLMHRTINQLAIYELPVPMQAFFFKNQEELVKASVRPDQRRYKDPTEATKHFIDLEAFGADAQKNMPLQWEEAVKKYSKDTLLEYGYVPYHVAAMKDRLTKAFAAKNADSIVFLSADLAHYIGDAHVPLHTTINYDGQLTNQKGLHALWESVIPEIDIEKFPLTSKHRATYLKTPEKTIWFAVRSGAAMVKNLLEQERITSLDFTESTKYRIQNRKGKEVKYYTTAFAKAYHAKLGNSIELQLIRSADMVADFWYTCWVDGGKPDLNVLLKTPLTAEENNRWKEEYNAFQSGKLLEQGMLRAKQEKSED